MFILGYNAHNKFKLQNDFGYMNMKPIWFGWWEIDENIHLYIFYDNR